MTAPECEPTTEPFGRRSRETARESVLPLVHEFLKVLGVDMQCGGFERVAAALGDYVHVRVQERARPRDVGAGA